MANGVIKRDPMRLDPSLANLAKGVDFMIKNRTGGGEQSEIYFLKEGLVTGMALYLSRESDGYYLYVSDTSQDNTWRIHAYIKLNTLT
jgi:hypothetical protein